MMLAACEKAAPEQPNAGTARPVSFTCDSGTTRTSFGETGDEVIPIYWTDGDRVRIGSAHTTPAEADYTVAVDGERQTSGTLHSLTAGGGLNWGADTPHDFYGFYPATAPGLKREGCRIIATLPAVQQADGERCDMALAYMTARAAECTPGDAVTLRFQPAVTLLDISFTPTERTEVLEVVVRSTSGDHLSGTFTYDPARRAIEGAVTAPSSIVSVRQHNPDGTVGCICDAGEEFRTRVFLLPQKRFTGLRVEVITAEGVIGRTVNVPVAGLRRTGIALGKLPALSGNAAASARRYRQWMHYLPDNLYVTDLSIPGTHDAATSTLSPLGYQCQNMALAEQLDLGVRFFDLRPGTGLNIYHGASNTGVAFDDAVAAMAAFMDNYPSEACFVVMQNETGWEEWAAKMGEYLHTASIFRDRFIAYRPDLTLGECRGKIMILSRNDYNSEIVGGRITDWGDNEANRVTPVIGPNTEGTLRLQDHYNLLNRNKQAEINAMLDLTRGEGKEPLQWVMNFTSLAGLSPKSNAKRYNPATAAYLLAHPGRTGVVMMDFAGDASTGGDELVKRIIDQNGRYTPAGR